MQTAFINTNTALNLADLDMAVMDPRRCQAGARRAERRRSIRDFGGSLVPA